MIPPRLAALVLAGVALISSTAHAADDTFEPHRAADATVTLVGGLAWILTETVFKEDLAPSACRWCDTDASGADDLNALDRSFRNGLRWHDTAAADTSSSVTAFVLVPLGAFGLDALAALHDDRGSGWRDDALVILESGVLAAGLNQVVKNAVGRERPFVHFLPADAKGNTDRPSDNNVSFFSGHTTLAFALAVSSGTVASMRGYRYAPEVWATGLTLAATTGYLRIAADRHYFTDTLTGAIIGSAIGFGVPYVLHRSSSAERVDANVSAGPLPGGGYFTLSYRW